MMGFRAIIVVEGSSSITITSASAEHINHSLAAGLDLVLINKNI
jgi:hypothetical protein